MTPAHSTVTAKPDVFTKWVMGISATVFFAANAAIIATLWNLSILVATHSAKIESHDKTLSAQAVTDTAQWDMLSELRQEVYGKKSE